MRVHEQGVYNVVMKNRIVIFYLLLAFGGVLFATLPQPSPQRPVVLRSVEAVLTVAGNDSLLQRRRAQAEVSWDDARQIYSVTLDRWYFCPSCSEASAVAELFFVFKADREVCFALAALGDLAQSGRYFASFSSQSGGFAYSAQCDNSVVAVVSTSSLLDQPGQYYVLKLHAVVRDGNSLRLVPQPGGEVTIQLKYKRHFTAPAVAR